MTNNNAIPQRPICPCKNCDNKGCGEYHAKCKNYTEYTKNQTAYRDAINQHKEMQYQNHAYIRHAVKRMQK